MASPPPHPWFSTFWSLLLALLVAQPSVPDADSIPPDRGNDDGVLDAGLAADAGEEGSDPVVILDSGAACHATGDARLLSEFAAAVAAVLDSVRTRDGRELPVAGAGTVATEKFWLSGVLYVPGLPSGAVLVSVQQLAALGYLVMFGAGRCLVMDRGGGKLVGEGRLQEDGLYRLQCLKIPLDAATDGTGSEVA